MDDLKEAKKVDAKMNQTTTPVDTGTTKRTTRPVPAVAGTSGATPIVRANENASVEKDKTSIKKEAKISTEIQPIKKKDREDSNTSSGDGSIPGKTEIIFSGSGNNFSDGAAGESIKVSSILKPSFSKISILKNKFSSESVEKLGGSSSVFDGHELMIHDTQIPLSKSGSIFSRHGSHGGSVLLMESETATPGIRNSSAINGEQETPLGSKRFLGMGYMVLASISFSLALVFVKLLSSHHVFTLGVYRFLGGCVIPAFPLIIYYQFWSDIRPFEPFVPLCHKGKRKVAIFLFLRCCSGCLSTICHYTAINYLRVSDATVIAFSTPVFVTFLASIILGEKFGVVNIFAALLTTVGVVIVARPSFLTGEVNAVKNRNTEVGVALAVGAMLSGTFVFLFLRLLHSVHFAVITFTFGLMGTSFCLIGCASVRSCDLPHSLYEWALALGLSVGTFSGQVCATLAFKYEDAGPLSMVRTGEVVFAFFWQAVLLNDKADKYR